MQGMAGQALENEQRHAHEPEQAMNRDGRPMNRDGRHSPGGRASSKIPLQHAREWCVRRRANNMQAAELRLDQSGFLGSGVKGEELGEVV